MSPEVLARAFLAIHAARFHTCNAAPAGSMLTHSLSCRTYARAMVLFAEAEAGTVARGRQRRAPSRTTKVRAKRKA